MKLRRVATVLACLVAVLTQVTILVPAGAAAPLTQVEMGVPPGPGLGESAARPSGTPVDLKLPPGYSLVGIRGGNSEAFFEECPGLFSGGTAPLPPQCQQVRGPFSVTLTLQYDPAAIGEAGWQRAASTAMEADEPMLGCLTNPPSNLWTGWVLVAGGEAQNIWVPVYSCLTTDGTYTPILDLPRTPSANGPGDESLGMASTQSPSTVELTLGGYCLNASRSAPGDSDVYDVGVLSDDPRLGEILAAIEGKNLNGLVGETQSEIQLFVWKYTDGEGLTAEDLDKLRALP